MLKKTKLRALVPGQWARVCVPDWDCWKEPGCHARPGDEVDICVMSTYKPRWDYHNSWQWSYRVGFRHAERAYFYEERKDGYFASPWDFSLIDASLSSPNWDKATVQRSFEGKGVWLYEPASDDPELCPGGDWSRYECDTCKKFVTPFSNDRGDIVCPYCEVSGLVILDEAQLDLLEQTREFARERGLSEQLERQLDYLANYADHGEPKRQCVLSYDFAPIVSRSLITSCPSSPPTASVVLVPRRPDFSRSPVCGRWLVPVAHREPGRGHRLVLPYVRNLCRLLCLSSPTTLATRSFIVATTATLCEAWSPKCHEVSSSSTHCTTASSTLGLKPATWTPGAGSTSTASFIRSNSCRATTTHVTQVFSSATTSTSSLRLSRSCSGSTERPGTQRRRSMHSRCSSTSASCSSAVP